MKCQESINMENHLKKARGGDVIAQGVQNMAEALECTTMSFTRDIVKSPPAKDDSSGLDSLFEDSPADKTPVTEEGGTLTFENDGKPGASSIKEFQDHFITIGAVSLEEFGKSQDRNFNKGHTTFYQALWWEIWTGNVHAVAHSCMDIDVNEDGPFYQGTKLVLHMPVGHETLAKSDADIKRYLSGFITKKKVLFNGEVINTTALDLNTFKPVGDTDGVLAKYGSHYHGFQLSSGDIAPVEYKNVEYNNCAVIVTNINAVDTERTHITYWGAEALRKFGERAERDEARGQNGFVTNLLPAIRKHEKFLKDLARVYFKRSIPPIEIKTVEDAARLELLSIALYSLYEDENDFSLVYPGKCILDDATKSQQALIKGVDDSVSRLNPFFKTAFHANPEDLLANVMIGRIFENGDTTDSAMIKDLDPENPRAVWITDSDLWRGYSSTTCRFIAITDLGEKAARLAYGSSYTHEYFSHIANRDGASVMPAPRLGWAMGTVTSAIGIATPASNDDEAESRWIAIEVDNIPFLVERADVDETDDFSPDDDDDVREYIRSNYDLDKALARLTEMRACIGAVYRFHVINGYCMTCCYASKRQEKIGPAFNQGKYIAVSPKMTIPSFKDGIIDTMLRTAVHEMVHNLGYNHGTRMLGAEHVLWRTVVGTRGLKSSIKAELSTKVKNDE